MAGDRRRKIEYSLDETVQTVDLDKLIGRKTTAAEKETFVTLAIERIIERTQSGVDINGNSFAEYSEDYADKKGVDVSEVDLTLMGDMLLSIKRFPDRKNVKFGINDDKEAKKSFNHNTGDTLKKRTFFGLTVSEQKQIANAIKNAKDKPTTVRQAREQRELTLREAIDAIQLVRDDDG